MRYVYSARGDSATGARRQQGARQWVRVLGPAPRLAPAAHHTQHTRCRHTYYIVHLSGRTPIILYTVFGVVLICITVSFVVRHIKLYNNRLRNF